MSLQVLFPVCVVNFPTKSGAVGSEMSIKAVPLFSPIKAYSTPVSGSTHPQESLANEANISLLVNRDCISYPSQGNPSANPLSQGVCACNIERLQTKKTAAVRVVLNIMLEI